MTDASTSDLEPLVSSESLEEDTKTEAPPSGARRFARLASMTASVAARHAGSRIKSAFQSRAAQALDRAQAAQKNGERIAKTLGELKGAAMKIGQMASIGYDVLPKEIVGALQTLQKEAPPLPYEAIAGQIERELGARPEQLFRRFDRAPFASASIGQVHRATTDDGREVVVKVQYPGVDGSVDSDLAHLKLALKASGMLRDSPKNLDALFAEISARLHEELDYCNEADNARLFKKFHAQHDFVVVPSVVGERSSKRILTLEYEPGDPLGALDRLGYDQDVRNRAGTHLLRLALAQLFELRAIHADPNPANFAFRRDGTLVLYDFGCVKKLKPEIVTAYGATLKSAIERDYVAVDRGLVALGARRLDGPPVEDAYYETWRGVLIDPFLRVESFDYGTTNVHAEIRALLPGLFKRLSSFQAAVEVVFIDRMMGGLYGNLRNLRAQVPVRSLVEPCIEAAAREAGPR